jgi:chemotaxis protein methyltransferase CheR
MVNQSKERIEKSILDLQSEYINLISDKLGISIHKHQKKELNNSILNACKYFNCEPDEYLKLINECDESSPLMSYLITSVTIGETYFFRDKNQMNYLYQTLLPKIINNKRQDKNLSLRIWSSGCASGEEVYSIAMMLNEMLIDIKKWTINLLATDININSLKKAVDGNYAEWSMRSIPSEFKQKYFKQNKGAYQISSTIINMVNFNYQNLNDSNYPSIFSCTNAQDLILCRNVLIYIDTAKVTTILNKLSNSLIPGGYLILGASDPIGNNISNLQYHNDGIIYYTRPELEEIKISQENFVCTEQLINQQIISHDVNIYVDKEYITTEKKYTKAIELANNGQLDKAIDLFNQCLNEDSTNKYIYYALAMALSEKNNYVAAEDALRKSIYLDHEFTVAHYHLGLLLKQTKKEIGIKYIKNALNIAKIKPSTTLVDGADDLTYGKLVEILSNELEVIL